MVDESVKDMSGDTLEMLAHIVALIVLDYLVEKPEDEDEEVSDKDVRV